jgi:hypothetical protein
MIIYVKVQTSAKISECLHKVRLGSQNDGGYIVCYNDVRESHFLLSFGISDDWTFEEDFLSKNSGVSVHAYDHSIDFVVMLTKLLKAFPNLLLGRIGFSEFLRRFLLPMRFRGFFTDKNLHFKEKVAVSDVGKTEVSIETIFSRISSNSIFLKMDIEGSEYEVLTQIVERAERFTGIVIEFHDIGSGIDRFLSSLSELSKSFDIIHIHGNNYDSFLPEIDFPNVIELTLSRKGLHSSKLSFLKAPISDLDSPNNPKIRDLSFTLNTHF